jgi:hypothetical protein
MEGVIPKRCSREEIAFFRARNDTILLEYCYCVAVI